MAPKKISTRKYSSKKRPAKKYASKSKKTSRISPNLAKAVKQILMKNIETKKTVNVNVSRSNLLHNGLVMLDSTPLKTSQGTSDPDVGGTMLNRIGDKVTPVGLSIKFMVMLDPRQQHVHFRWLFIRAASGDVPTISTLFVGATDNKRLDSVDTERFTIIASKSFVVNRPNATIGGTDYTMNSVNSALEPTGMYNTAGAQDQGYSSHPISVWIPGYKFGKAIQYDSGGQSPKTYSYFSVILPYTSWKATSAGIVTTGTPLGLMEDYVSKFYFKDA